MKPIRKISLLFLVIFSLFTTSNFAQRTKVVRANQPNRKVIVETKRYHLFRKTVVYHPHWAPKVSFHRRWVYFPLYNFYWDNYRNVYVVRSGSVWVKSTTKPKEYDNVDLSTEKIVELDEENDNQDSIQDKNAQHQKVFKIY